MSEQKDFLQRFNLKDEQAYHKLFQQFYSYLVLFAERRVENHKVAEDIVQEIFINIWESNKQYNSINGFKAYLCRLLETPGSRRKIHGTCAL